MVKQQELDITKALLNMRKAMQLDYELAWSWHCNLACIMEDTGIEHAAANKAAARFMLMAFNADTRPKMHAERIRTNFRIESEI